MSVHESPTTVKTERFPTTTADTTTTQFRTYIYLHLPRFLPFISPNVTYIFFSAENVSNSLGIFTFLVEEQTTQKKYRFILLLFQWRAVVTLTSAALLIHVVTSFL